MTCDVCGLPDLHQGQGDGIGSCDCPRCECGAARGSYLCDCVFDECDDWGNGDDVEWPDDELGRPVVTVELPGISR
ncbi:hypothetical protein ACWER9_06595 [Micromonospora sp. NPDC003944]